MVVARGAFANKVLAKMKKNRKKKVMKTVKKTKFSRLEAFARGAIWGMHLADAPRDVIQKSVLSKRVLGSVRHTELISQWSGLMERHVTKHVSDDKSYSPNISLI